MSRTMHLVCNAHLDPVWLWEWQEGAAEALSTFRAAADLCEEFDGFVFNHNEAILYRWVEEYEPELFSRIRRLVDSGKWHIMGGWFLQPDCNMPSGESFVRQALVGKRYFKEKFGTVPTTAINFDPFGHTRGLVQILAKSGSDSYLFCRPSQRDCPLPADDFRWVGYDGSSVAARRAAGYNSGLGQARKKVESVVDSGTTGDISIVLWGVGNHGGGPSRQDLRDLAALMAERPDAGVRHSTAEAYFADLVAAKTLPEHRGDLNSWAPGCYTSQIRIKQLHRALENEYYRSEKMASHASFALGVDYPKAELDEALLDLLTSEFHDILPGSSIRPAEESALRLIEHGREIVSRVTARSFFSLCGGQPKAADGTYPVFVYNPHPYRVEGIFACEWNLADQNWGDTWTLFDVTRDGAPVASQVERELSNINLDWRKRVVFAATLEPSSLNRFDAKPVVVDRKPLPARRGANGSPGGDGRYLVFGTDRMELVIDTMTGLVDRFEVDGELVAGPDGFRPVVITDYEDPWGTSVSEFRRLEGAFALLDRVEAARFAGIDDRTIDPVRIVEEGDARTVVEASFGYRDSRLLLTYSIPKDGASFELEVDVLWQEKNRMLKLAVASPFTHPVLHGQVAFGVETLPSTGKELVSQKWQCLSAGEGGPALLCIDDGIYGSDFDGRELRLSLLRSAAYSAHTLGGRDIVAKNRHTPRIDQGARRFRFRFEGGSTADLLERADREALSFNEAPYVLSFYPSGAGTSPGRGVEIDGEAVVLAACKRAEDSDAWVLRLFNPTAASREVVVKVEALGVDAPVTVMPFEIKTLLVGAAKLAEVDLLELPVGGS